LASSVPSDKPALRVLHVTSMFPTAAQPSAGSYVETLVRGLETLRVRQEVMAIPYGGPKGKYWRVARQIRELAQRDRFDLVHAHYGLAGWAAMWHSLPLVITYAGSDLAGVAGPIARRLRGRLEVALSHWAGLRADRVIVVSQRMLALLRLRDLRSKAVVLPYGIDTKRFAPGSREHARRVLGLGSHEKIVLWPHADRPVKRRDLAEAAVAEARRAIPELRLWKPPALAGEEMPLCYHAADCLLLMSDSEGSPTVVKEALSTALPVIGVDVGDVWEWIGRVAWCRRVGRDPRDVAQAIVEVVRGEPPPTPPRWISAFDVTATAQRLLEVYATVLTDHERCRGVAT